MTEEVDRGGGFTRVFSGGRIGLAAAGGVEESPAELLGGEPIMGGFVQHWRV